MKKHILLASLLLANLAFMRDIKANGSVITPCSVTTSVPSGNLEIANNPAETTSTFTKFISFFYPKKAKSKKAQPQVSAVTLQYFKQVNGGDNPQVGELLFSNEKISISSIYPNPASSYASIDYNLMNQNDQAKIILCNVLGNVVGEYPLVKDAKRLYISTQELSSGVYFYTLSVQGKSLITKKLIIKHQS